MKYKSEAMEAIHEQAVEMYKTGGITEASMLEYDELCLKNPKVKKSYPVYSDENSMSVKQVSPVTAIST